MNLSAEEQKQLAEVVGCEVDDLPHRIEPFKEAAAEEYFRMILGQRVFTRGSDLREYRLLLLIRHVYKRLPDESEISAVFQTTSTQSRSLLRAVMSKYQYELAETTRTTLKGLLDNAKAVQGGGAEVMLHAENLADSMNQLLAHKNGYHTPVKRKAGTTAVYEISKDSLKALKEMTE